MERNVGERDRIVRLVLGALLAVAGIAAVAGYWTAGLVVGAVALLAGVVLVATGASRTCPIYAGAGVDTIDGQQ